MLQMTDRPTDNATGIHTLDYARQVLKDVSDWQKNVISDLEHKKRTFRTEELYHVVDAIGQDEAQVEAARVKQLVREHLLVAEEEVKKMVSEQVKANVIFATTPTMEPKKVTKFSSRLPRVALLPPKGRKLNDKISPPVENQDTPGAKVLRKRPPPRPRPKTLSELMESHVKPLPSNVLEEFGLSASRVHLPERFKIPREVSTEIHVRSTDHAIPLAPPTRSRPISAPIEQATKSNESGNVALINLTPKEKEIRKLNLQILPSIDIKGQPKLFPESKRTNVKLISVIEPEAKPKEIENELAAELPGSQVTNLLHPLRREDHKSGNPTTIQKKELSLNPQTNEDSMQNAPFQRLEPSVLPQTLHFDNGQSKTPMQLTDRKLLTNDSTRPRYVHPYLIQERLPGSSSHSQPVVRKFPSSIHSSGLTSDNIFRNITSIWTEQEMIAKIVQELTRNTETSRTDNQHQNYFSNDELIKQLVLEVIHEDLLARSSTIQAPSSNSNGRKTNNKASPEVTKSINSKDSSKIDQKNGDSNVPSSLEEVLEENKPKIKEVLKRNDQIGEKASSNNSIGTRDKAENSNLSIETTGNGSDKKAQGDSKSLSHNLPSVVPDSNAIESRNAEPAKVVKFSREVGLVNENIIAPSPNVIPRDIAVHVIIEDKRSLERRDDNLSLKTGNCGTTTAKPTEMRSESEKIFSDAKPNSKEVIPTASMSTGDAVREKVNANLEENAVNSKLAHLELKKEFREIGVNATVENKKELASVGIQVEEVPIDFLSPDLNAPSEIVSPISPIKSPFTSSGDEENEHKSVRDVGIQLSGGHTSSSVTTDNTTLTTTASSEEPISEGELLFKYQEGIVRLPACTLDSTLQSIDEGEITRTLSDGEIAVSLQHPLERVLSVGEIQEAEESEELVVVAPPLTEPKTKVGKREDRSKRPLKLTSSFSEGEMTQKQSSSGSEESTSTGTSPDIG